VDQAERLRELAAAARLRPPGVSDSANRDAHERLRRLASLVGWTWARWALGLVGVLGVMVTVMQAFAPGARVEMTGAHLLGESVAWSAAIGLVMIAAAVRPGAAAGLAGVLIAYSAVLAVYVVGDAATGAVTLLREVTHLPVVVGAVLALLVWRGNRAPRPSPRRTASQPPNADTRDSASAPARAHRRPRDGSAA
jgi:predicted anti-sigma-YlaC factor YlaD